MYFSAILPALENKIYKLCEGELLPVRMLRVGTVFSGVCLSDCLSAQNLENYWSEIDVTW